MTQKDKDLLFKDLSARLPYDYVVEYKGESYNVSGIVHGRLVLCKPFMSQTLEYCPLVEEVKPYLFPLSNMTDKQKKEFKEISECEDKISDCGGFDSEGVYLIEIGKYKYEYDTDTTVEEFYFNYGVINWLLENNFDIYGLIPMGLAIDATNKNIY